MTSSQPKHLALYYYDTCPFCVKTRQVIDKLTFNVELRNAQRNQQHRTDLRQEGGKTQVPCLRIKQSNGYTQWLYESGDIIRFLTEIKA